jgi:S1-C subfamily serine protease
MLGVRYFAITKDYAAANNLPVNQGALVYSSSGEAAVVSGSPAAKAGIRSGDIITKINNEAIAEGKSLLGILYKYKPGDVISITYIRDKATKTVRITLAESK